MILRVLSSVQQLPDKPMLDPVIEAPPPPRGRRQFMFLLVLASIMLLPLEAIVGSTEQTGNQGIYSVVGDPEKETPEPVPYSPITFNSVLHYFDGRHMEGTWKHKATSYPSGKALVTFSRRAINNSQSSYAMIELMNGNYIDHGYVRLTLPFELLGGKETLVKGNYTFYGVGNVNLGYSYWQKLETIIPETELPVRSLNISFQQFHANDKVSITIGINTGQFSVDILDVVQSWHTFHHIFLSLVLTVILSLQFVGTMHIIRKIGFGQCPAEKYSVVSFFFILMWDFAVTITTFSLSFSSDQLFLIYLIPTFISGILFAITQVKILQMIYQSTNQNQSRNFKQMMRIMAWLGLISTYPLVVYTNLSSVFFALLPLILLPQLHRNAQRGQRSQLDVDFLKLYLPRFLLILYLKGYPKNVFNIEPSFVCCLGMLAVLAAMMGLLMLQRKFGNRFIFPKFLLPSVYNYFQDEAGYSVDIEIGVDNMQDCAICLAPVHMQPLQESQLSGQHVGKVMTTPCKHKFHGTCLVQWMEHKMECPTCRSKVPSYD